MKHGIWMLAVVGVLAFSATARAEEFPGGTACVTGGAYNGVGYVNNGMFVGGSVQTQTYCSLKRISCSSFPCTKTATLTVMDNHSGTAADESVTCRLVTFGKGGAGYHTQGSWSTYGGSVGVHGTLSLSVTMSGFDPNDGYLVAECLLGKADVSGNRSDVSWVSAND
jgi:hypothetical protein